MDSLLSDMMRLDAPTFDEMTFNDSACIRTFIDNMCRKYEISNATSVAVPGENVTYGFIPLAISKCLYRQADIVVDGLVQGSFSPEYIPEIVVCDDHVDTMLFLKNTAYSNRVFLVKKGSLFYYKLMPFFFRMTGDLQPSMYNIRSACSALDFQTAEDDGFFRIMEYIETEGDLMWTQRANELGWNRPQAQALFENLVSVPVDSNQVVDHLFSKFEEVLNAPLFKTASVCKNLIGLILHLIQTCENPSSVGIAAFLYNLFTGMGNVLPGLVMKAVAFVTPYFSDESRGKPKAQGLMESYDLITGIIATIGTLISVVGLSQLPKKNIISDSITFAGTVGRAMVGVNALFKFLENNFVSVFDFLFEKIMGYPRGLSDLGSLEDEVRSFIEAVIKAVDKDKVDNFRSDEKYRSQLRSLRHRGNTLHNKCAKLKFTPKEMHVLTFYTRQVEKLCADLRIFGTDGGGPRPEPVVTHFFGASGCGKSHVPNFLAPWLVAELAKDDPSIMRSNLMKHVYYRNIEQEFWDGYCNQEIVVYDDFGQKKDQISSPNEEFMEVIRVANIAPYPLHMASIIEKACTYFTTKAVLLTSNSKSFNVQSLQHPYAFVRRLDLNFEVSVHPKYLNPYTQIIDEDKVKQAFGGPSEQIYMFTPYELKKVNANYTLSPIIDEYGNNVCYDFNTMAQIVTSKMRTKQTHSQERIDVMNQIFVKRIKEMAGVQSNGSDTDTNYETADQRPKRLRKRLAQMCLSQWEEFLYIFHYTGGVIDDFYDRSKFNDNHLKQVESVLETCKDFDSFWAFLADNPLEMFIPLIKEDMQNKVDFIFQFYSDEPIWMDYYDEGKFAERRTIWTKTKEMFAGFKARAATVLDTEWFKFLIGFVTGLTTIWGVYKLFTGIKRNVVESTVSGDSTTNVRPRVTIEANPSGDNVTSNRPVVVVEGNPSGDQVTHLKPKVVVESACTQALVDTNADQVINSAIYKNLYRIGDEQKGVANILFVAERFAICNWHVWDHLSARESITLFSPVASARGSGPTYKIPVKSVNVIRMLGSDGEEKDCVILEFPRLVQSHTSIIRHFVKSEDISKFNESRALLVGYARAGASPSIMTINRVNAVAKDQDFEYDYQVGNKLVVMKMRKYYEYFANTCSGDCGSVLVLTETKIQRKIAGLHVAGEMQSAFHNGVGYALSVTQQDLERALEGKTLISTPDYETHSRPFAHLLTQAPEGDFTLIGELEKPVSRPVKTDLRHSVIYGSVDVVKTAPSTLLPKKVDGEVVDPLRKGLEKCGKPCEFIDEDLLAMAADNFRPCIFPNTSDKLRKVLTYQEVIEGIPGLEYMAPMNRRSSPGFGWTDKTKGKIGKTKWLGDGEYIFDNAELKEAFDARERAALTGVRLPHYWVDTLKDERRPLEKVKSAKTRVFSVGQMDYIMLVRKYFLGFNAHVMSNRINNEIAVGINAYSIEWTVLASHLSRKGKKVIAGDFSNFDGSLNPQIMWKILDLINDWYDDGEQNALVRRVLWEDIVSSVHVFDKLVYQWNHSQPSGNPMTTVINSMYNSLSMRIVYCLMFGSTEGFVDYVSMVSYGDDNVVNISSAIIDNFNQETISEYYSKIGMTYTDESKGKNKTVPYRTLDNIEFLKRGFRKFQGRYEAPLTLDTVLEMVNWVRGTLDVRELCKINVVKACEELALHSKEVFEHWTRVMKIACRRVDLHPEIHSYENMKRIVNGRSTNLIDC